MRAILEHVDSVLIDRVFQPIVHRIAQALRVDCFQQARICTAMAAVVWIIPQARAIAGTARSSLVALQVFQASLLLLVLTAIMVLHTLFQRMGGSGHHRINPLRASMFTHRIGTLLGLMMNVAQGVFAPVSWTFLALSCCVTASVYVAACANPPPKPRVRTGMAWGWR